MSTETKRELPSTTPMLLLAEEFEKLAEAQALTEKLAAMRVELKAIQEAATMRFLDALGVQCIGSQVYLVHGDERIRLGDIKRGRHNGRDLWWCSSMKKHAWGTFDLRTMKTTKEKPKRHWSNDRPTKAKALLSLLLMNDLPVPLKNSLDEFLDGKDSRGGLAL